MNDHKDLLKIGDFARVAGTNLRTLRYYEELGLLAPASRSHGGFRYYRPCDVNRLHMIRDLQELGLHLERIRDLMSTRDAVDDRPRFLDRVRAALAEQDRLLAQRIEALHEQRARIADAQKKVDECQRCKLLPGPGNNFCEPCTVTGMPLPAKISALF